MHSTSMYERSFIILLLCLTFQFSSGLPNPTSIIPCRTDDSKCMTKSAQAALKYILSGIPELGIEHSDPLHIDFIESSETSLKYTYTNTTLIGFKNCEIKNVQLSLETSKLKYDLYCKLEMFGQYELHGRLLILPVEGKGTFTIDADKLHIGVNADLKKVQSGDGKSHLNIKNFKLEIDAVEKVVFNFENLFNGNKELADGVLKFANENYKEVVSEVSGPFYNAVFKKIFKIVNKYFKSVTFEDLILQRKRDLPKSLCKKITLETKKISQNFSQIGDLVFCPAKTLHNFFLDFTNAALLLADSSPYLIQKLEQTKNSYENQKQSK